MTTEKPPVIAIVDDEEMVLTSLRSFLTLETDYEIATYDSPAKAVEQIRESTVDLVISDYLMPEMNGIEFLLEIKKLHPYATRILLTGYADKENAIKAINEVGLYQYIEKPWENEELKLVIHRTVLSAASSWSALRRRSKKSSTSSKTCRTSKRRSSKPSCKAPHLYFSPPYGPNAS